MLSAFPITLVNKFFFSLSLSYELPILQALGNFYFIHKALKDVHLYDYKGKGHYAGWPQKTQHSKVLIFASW